MKMMLPPDDEPKWLVHAYVDGELDPANARAIERRIANDAALAAERDRIEALGRALRSNFPLTPPPAALRERIDVVERNPVPTLVYHHRKHLISLTAIPAPRKPDAAPVSRAIEGYNVIEWTGDGVTYWVVSDVAVSELAHFTELFRSTPSDQ